MIIKTDYPPTPQNRPRVTRNVTYDTSVKDKKDFLKSVLTQLPKEPLNEALIMQVKFYFKRPKSHYNSKGKLKMIAPTQHTKKPDIDNLLKFVLDALNKHLYVDDSQVVSLTGKKFYADKEGIEISVRALSELGLDEKYSLYLRADMERKLNEA